MHEAFVGHHVIFGQQMDEVASSLLVAVVSFAHGAFLCANGVARFASAFCEVLSFSAIVGYNAASERDNGGLCFVGVECAIIVVFFNEGPANGSGTKV